MTLDFAVAWSEKRIRSESTKTAMSVATTVKRYINSFATDAGQNRILSGLSCRFSSSFMASCRFWLAANSIWATLILVAAATVTMRLRIARSWPLIAFTIFISAGLVFREFWRSIARGTRGARISLNTLLILALGLASTGFLLWPCVTRGAFVSVTGDTFMYSAHAQYLVDHRRGFAFGLPPVDQYAMSQSETRFGTASVLGFFSVLFHSSTAAVLPVYVFIVLANRRSGPLCFSIPGKAGHFGYNA